MMALKLHGVFRRLAMVTNIYQAVVNDGIHVSRVVVSL
jgi:hypothetical protein